jgi:hypothetical protein
MTTFAGNFSGSIEYSGYGGQSGNITDTDAGVQVFDAWLADDSGDYGNLTDNLPIAQPEETFAGFRGFSGGGNDHWYYRFHVIPTSINVGNIINDTSDTFIVWNAWPTAKTVSSLTASGDTSGLVVSPPDGYEVPYLLAGYEDHEYTLDVSVNGASLIDVTYTFTFSSGEITDLVVTGQRIFAWTFRPDWSNPIEERMEWVTDVLTAYDGTEQRIALRSNPRRNIGYQFAIDNASDRRKFEAMLFNWGARTWLLPVWMEGSALSSGLASGESTVTLDRVDGNWQEGGYGIIWASAFSYEIVKVDTINGDEITFEAATGTEFSPGAVIYPAVTGILGDRQALNRFTRDTEYGRCQFQVFETETVAADSPTTYRGLPVITQAPHWQRDITHDFVRKLQEIDFRIGKFAIEDESEMPFNVISHHWVANGKDEIDALRSFIYARQGKQKAVWLPTFAPDILMVASAGSASVYIDVEYAYILKHLWGHQNRKDIRIELYDGTVIYRRVTDVTEQSATVERLTINSALGVDIDPDDVERISWMSVARLDSDSISFAWMYDDWVECSVNWRTVRDDV